MYCCILSVFLFGIRSHSYDGLDGNTRYLHSLPWQCSTVQVRVHSFAVLSLPPSVLCLLRLLRLPQNRIILLFLFLFLSLSLMQHSLHTQMGDACACRYGPKVDQPHHSIRQEAAQVRVASSDALRDTSNGHGEKSRSPCACSLAVPIHPIRTCCELIVAANR